MSGSRAARSRWAIALAWLVAAAAFARELRGQDPAPVEETPLAGRWNWWPAGRRMGT